MPAALRSLFRTLAVLAVLLGVPSLAGAETRAPGTLPTPSAFKVSVPHLAQLPKNVAPAAKIGAQAPRAETAAPAVALPPAAPPHVLTKEIVLAKPPVAATKGLPPSAKQSPPPPARGPPAVRAPLPGADPVSVAPGEAFHLALGIGAAKTPGGGLHNFATAMEAKTYGDLYFGKWNPGSLEKLKTNIASIIHTSSKISFNLDGFDMARFHAYVATTKTIAPADEQIEFKGITNWELKTVLSDPNLRAKATFYGPGGKPVDPPSLEPAPMPMPAPSPRTVPAIQASL